MGVHRTACLSRRLGWMPVPRCHEPDLPSSTSGLSSTGESVARCTAFPPHTARCSHGLWIEHVPMPAARVALDSVVTRCPFRGAVPLRTRVLPPESSRVGKILGLSGSGSRCCGRPEGRRSPVRFADNPKTAALPEPPESHPSRGRSGSVARHRPPEGVRATPRGSPEGSRRAPEGPRAPPFRSVSPEGDRSPASSWPPLRRAASRTQYSAPKGRHRCSSVTRNRVVSPEGATPDSGRSSPTGIPPEGGTPESTRHSLRTRMGAPSYQPRAPEGARGGRAARHVERGSWRLVAPTAPASWMGRARARLTSSPRGRVRIPVRVPKPSHRPEGRWAGAEAPGARLDSAQLCPFGL